MESSMPTSTLSVSRTILVVDDDALFRGLLEKLLHQLGHRVLLAADGEAALACQTADLPDIVLMDVVMPGMGGIEATRRLRAMNGRLPIVLISAQGDDDSRIQGLSAGADDYLYKPLKLPLLQHKLARIEQLLAERQQLDGAMAQLRRNASVFDVSRDGMVITDARRKILDVNRAFCEITGYTRDELIGNSPGQLRSGLTPAAVYADMWQTLHTTRHWRGEVTNRHKDGEVYREQLSISAVHDEAGEITSYVGIINRINKLRDDIVTGLPNRHQLAERLHRAIARNRRRQGSLACLVLGLDRFSAVNATLGHVAGDLVLREAARRLGEALRACDTLIRSGGDEFTLILGELPDSLWVDDLVHDLLHGLAQAFVVGSESIHLSASAGLAFHAGGSAQPGDLLQHAEMAMRAAKALGGNRCEYFQPSMREEVLERRQLSEGLRQALDLEQFFLLFQPIVSLESGKIRKAEALLRWRHPQRGLVGPATFIALAEQTGLIHDIGRWVTRQAIAALPALRECCPEFQLSVNVSPAQFEAPAFAIDVHRRELAALGLPGSALVLEITEGLLLEGNARVRERLHECRSAGMQVAIDDFGTGYSCLSYLNRFATDYLKIDRSFVRHLRPDSRELSLCEAIIAMGHSLGLRVVAEGVETLEQHRLLRRAGCDFAQGYLYGRPMSLPDLLDLLQQEHEPAGSIGNRERLQASRTFNCRLSAS